MGYMSSELKNKLPSMNITVYDLSKVVKIGKELHKNINFIEGNFFNDWLAPISKCSTILFKSVLHDHDDNTVLKLLLESSKKCENIIICEVMENIEDIRWEDPYFRYLIPFYSNKFGTFRNSEKYNELLNKVNMKVSEVKVIEKSHYTILNCTKS